MATRIANVKLLQPEILIFAELGVWTEQPKDTPVFQFQLVLGGWHTRRIIIDYWRLNNVLPCRTCNPELAIQIEIKFQNLPPVSNRNIAWYEDWVQSCPNTKKKEFMKPDCRRSWQSSRPNQLWFDAQIASTYVGHSGRGLSILAVHPAITEMTVTSSPTPTASNLERDAQPTKRETHMRFNLSLSPVFKLEDLCLANRRLQSSLFLSHIGVFTLHHRRRTQGQFPASHCTWRTLPPGAPQQQAIYTAATGYLSSMVVIRLFAEVRLMMELVTMQASINRMCSSTDEKKKRMAMSMKEKYDKYWEVAKRK
ncbi:hypothetical protein LXL04_003695 [Taraxacum kok-saghyz]